MKHLIRVATQDPYCYIETEYEGDTQDAVAEYQRLRHFTTGEAGVPAREFARIIHEYVQSGTIVNGGDEYGEYSVGQRAFVNEMTKLIRAKNK